MPIQVTCPSCARTLRVPDHLLGQMVKCPACENAFQASVNEGAPPPPQPEERVSPRAPEGDRERESYRERDRDYDRDDRDFDDRDFERGRRRLPPHRGDTVLWLGVAGLVLGLLGCIPLGIAPWIMGSQDLAAMRAGRMDPSGEGNTKTGYIMGIIGTIVFALWYFCGCILFVLSAAAG